MDGWRFPARRGRYFLAKIRCGRVLPRLRRPADPLDPWARGWDPAEFEWRDDREAWLFAARPARAVWFAGDRDDLAALLAGEERWGDQVLIHESLLEGARGWYGEG